MKRKYKLARNRVECGYISSCYFRTVVDVVVSVYARQKTVRVFLGGGESMLRSSGFRTKSFLHAMVSWGGERGGGAQDTLVLLRVRVPQGADVSITLFASDRQKRPRSTFRLSRAIRSVATGSQWSGQMK